jgi:hypothetical protein
MSENDSASNAGVILFNVEHFGWIDAILLIVGVIAPFIWLNDGIVAAIFVAICIAVTYIFYIASFIARFKKLRFPKRNYIRFFRNPNTAW